MKASFDGARRNLANAFNGIAKTELDEEQKEGMHDMRNAIVGLLCMYDENSDGDCNCLIDEVRLEEVK